MFGYSVRISLFNKSLKTAFAKALQCKMLALVENLPVCLSVYMAVYLSTILHIASYGKVECQ